MADDMTPEKKLPGWVKPVAGAAGAAVLAGGIALGVSRGQEQPQPVDTPTPSAAAASPIPERTPVPTPTVTAEPSPTKTPEVKPVPCAVLSPEICAQGELIIYKTPQGQEIKYVAWRDLPAGTPIFSPIDGQRTTAKITQPSPFQGSLLGVNPPDRSVSYNFTGDFEWGDPAIQSGKVIATITETGAKNFGEYDLVFTATRIDPATGRPVVAEEILKKLFLLAFEKQPKEVTYTGQNSTTVTAPDYYNKP